MMACIVSFYSFTDDSFLSRVWVGILLHLRLSLFHCSPIITAMQRDPFADLPYQSFAELLDHQAQKYASDTCLLYPDLSSEPLCYGSATFAQVNNAVNRLVGQYRKYIDVPTDAEKPVVVGLLANSSTDYLLTMYSLVKLGVAVFPLSTRNSQAALEHLVKITGTTYLIVGEGHMDLALDGLRMIPLQTVDWANENNSSASLPRIANDSLDRIVMIFHSSGSTSFPKPIRYTNRTILNMSGIRSDNLCQLWTGQDTVLTLGALFHILAFGMAIYCYANGATYALPLVKHYPPTPKQFIDNLRVERINKIASVSIFLEQLVYELENDKTISYDLLSRITLVVYGGSPLPDEICRKLVSHGVNLVSTYGTTETGFVMMRDLEAPAARWKWMKIIEHRKPFVQIRPDDQVLVHLPNDPYVVAGIANQPDGSYSTNDIMIEDPPGSNEYRIEGRQDDILVHFNGEKTNPVPMEATIRRFSVIAQALVFGHQRLCTGALIQLNRAEVENYSLDEILDQVREAVQAANHDAPSHSRIMPQMIKCLPLSKVLPSTDKGNLMRKKAITEYAQLIDRLYEQFLQPKEDDGEKGETPSNAEAWTTSSLENHLQGLISKISSKSRQHFHRTSQSVFDLGFDSLHSVQLHNDLHLLFPWIPLNFVYEHSSIDAMVNALLSKSSDREDRHHYALTESLIDKYTGQMEKDGFSKTLTAKKAHERVFLVTGANGSLGSWIVLDLLQEKSVAKVFCLFRGADKHRILKDFQQRQQPTEAFTENNQRVVLLPNMKLSNESLGQETDVYHQLCQQVTDVVHSAYHMDFNMTVRDFESDGILGTYHLLKLASRAGARFHFISSIAAAGSGLLPVIKEEALPRRPQLPIAQGYGQSKYVCEHLCIAAQRLWNLPVDIYRVGQISGDSERGAWNTSEMISLMICVGGGELGQLPSQGQDIQWIPVNVASSSIVSIALDDWISNDSVHHILNPHALPWSTFLQSLHRAGLRFRVVNPSEWLQTVLNSQTPLTKLASFFQTFFTSKDGFRVAEFETVKTEGRSKQLHECPMIDVDLLQKYLLYWHAIGFLPNGFEKS